MGQDRRRKKYNRNSRVPAGAAKYRTQLRSEQSGVVVCFPRYSRLFQSYPHLPIPPEPPGGVDAALGSGFDGLSGGF